MSARIQTPLPMRMRTLPKDSRGYPIPFIVMVDMHKQPQFTINDVRKVTDCRRKRLCAICGKRFDGDDMWFVGGSRCFLHADGAFLDPPAHLECATYALIVCPFLAASRYSKRIEDAKLKPEATPDDMKLVRVDYMPPALPEMFGLGLTQSFEYYEPRRGEQIHIVDQWDYVEWWRAGERVNAPDTGEPPPEP